MGLSSLFKPFGKLLLGGVNVLDDLGMREEVGALAKEKAREIVGALRLDSLFTEDVDAEWQTVVVERGNGDDAPILYTERLQIPEGVLYRISVRDRNGVHFFPPNMIGVGPKTVIRTDPEA